MAKKLMLEALPNHAMGVDWGELTDNEAMVLLICGIVALEANRLYQGRPGLGYCKMAEQFLGSEDCRKAVEENMENLQDDQSKD